MSTPSLGEHGTPLKVQDEVTALRNGTATKETLKKLTKMCVIWLQGFGTPLQEQELEDTASQALSEVVEDILNPGMPIEETCYLLKKALNRNRARVRRHTERFQGYGPAEELAEAVARYQEVDMEAQLDAKSAYEYMLEVVDFLKAFILLALEMLPNRDYAILFAVYGFAEMGLKPRGESPLPQLLPNARKVAVFRARQKLGEELEKLLRSASLVTDRDRKVVEDAFKLVHEGHLLDVLRR